jgi:hypothetical protein
MIKVKGIESYDIEWNYDSPPKFYRRIAKTPDSDGIFKTEVFKLKSFNNFTREAVYTKSKNEKMRSVLPSEQKFNYATPKKRSFEMED